MKRLASIGLVFVFLVSVFAGISITVGAASEFDGKTGYVKVWDFESWELGEVTGNNGDPTVSPIRGNGGYTATITDEWNYSGGTGKSIKFDSAQPKVGCVQFEHPRNISFTQTAYNAILFAVKVPKAPSNPNQKGFSIAFALNDWGVYYKTLNNSDVFQIKPKGSNYWQDVNFQDQVIYLPYEFEGIVKIDMNTLYKDVLPANPTQSDYDNARLKDNEIQHEVVIEMWLAQTGGEQGGFYFDDMFLRTPEATDTFDKEPVGGPIELNDFEGVSVGDLLFDSNNPDKNALWDAYGYTVKASDQFVGNGNTSAEFSSETARQTWGIIALLKTGTGNIKDKKYILMHIATPSADSSKGYAYQDGNGNPRFAFAIIPKTEINNAGQWYKTNTTIAGNVKMMADGEATWKAIPGDDFYNYLPFGWSGWIMYKIDSFVAGDITLDGSAPLTGMEVWTSQAGGRFGKVYLDSFFAIDEEDELPNGISAAGNKNGTDPTTPTQTTNDDDDLYIPTEPGETTKSSVTQTSAAKPVATGEPMGYVPIACVVASCMILMVAYRKFKKVRH